jgi:WD40 repeat protein
MISGQLRMTLKGHKEAVRGMAFNPDGKTLVSFSADDSIILWDTHTGRPVRTIKDLPIQSWMSIAFSPDGSMLACSRSLAPTKLWEAVTGKEQATIPNGTRPRSIAFSPDGKMPASGGQDQAVRIWDISRIKPEKETAAN